MQVRFWNKNAWRHGIVERKLSRGVHKGHLVVVYAHGAGHKRVTLDPAKVQILPTRANPVSAADLGLIDAWALKREIASGRKPAPTPAARAEPVYHIGEFVVLEEVKLRAGGTAYWVRRADGLTGYLEPHGRVFNFKEQADLFSPKFDNVPKTLPMQAPKSDFQLEREYKRTAQGSLFENPAPTPRAWTRANERELQETRNEYRGFALISGRLSQTEARRKEWLANHMDALEARKASNRPFVMRNPLSHRERTAIADEARAAEWEASGEPESHWEVSLYRAGAAYERAADHAERLARTAGKQAPAPKTAASAARRAFKVYQAAIQAHTEFCTRLGAARRNPAAAATGLVRNGTWTVNGRGWWVDGKWEVSPFHRQAAGDVCDIRGGNLVRDAEVIVGSDGVARELSRPGWRPRTPTPSALRAVERCHRATTRSGAIRNPEVLSGAIRQTKSGPAVRTYEIRAGKRKAVDIPLPAGIGTMPDWRVDLASKPRKLSRPIPTSRVTVVGGAGARKPGTCSPSPLVHCGPNGEVMGRALTSAGAAIDYEWRVVPLDKLIASHDAFDLRENANFPKALQPRDRSRGSYQDQISRLVGDFDPSLLFWSANVSDGAPIVGPDGVVESGNGRTMAITRVYRAHPDKARAYVAAAKAWARELGVAWPVGMQDPVLVRVRASKVDRAEFARAANVAGQQQMAAAEQALADAGQLTLDIIQLYNPDAQLAAGLNEGFVEAYVQRVAGPQARGDMITAHGKLSQSGDERIRFALFAKAYGVAAEPLIADLTESIDSDLKSVLAGMSNAAAMWARFVGDIARGEYGRQYDLTSSIVQMAMITRQAKAKGVHVNALLLQKDIERPISNEINLLAVASTPTGRANATSLTKALALYIDSVIRQGGNSQGTMFGPPPQTPPIAFLRLACNSCVLEKYTPTPENAAAIAHRLNDPAAVALWPTDWLEVAPKRNPARRPVRVPGGRARVANPGKYPPPPIQLPNRLPEGQNVRVGKHTVRSLGNGFVIVDGQRFRR